MIRFWRSESGNVAVIFTLAAIPAIGLIGASVDYGRRSHALSQMQIAVDSAALALSKLPNTTPKAEIEAKAEQYFNANFKEPSVSGVQLTVAPGKGILSLSATATMTPQVTILSSVSSMYLSASATVKWGTSKLEVALALDNTGSMSSSSKLIKLKQATTNLLTTLKAAAKNDGDVKVAIIPFATVVNIGTGYKNEPWMRWDSTETKAKNVTKSNWTGCVLDRDKSGDYDVTDASPSSSVKASLFVPSVSSPCGSLASMIPLSYDWTALQDKVDDMNATGNTNVTIGLEWAWHALSTKAPLMEGGTSTTEVPIEKVIVLLTDGDNTENRFCKNSPSWPSTSCSTSTIDTRTKLACTNVKNDDITIYTVRVIDGNKTLLKDCASHPSKYFEVTNSAELITVFDTIAGNLVNLYLSK
ncbi:MAG: VWA domain-containing protein [Methylacidiphilales bacterium]|nr:VWA domain-containing protein [Candidatus Methylacidiphilales bacterium]